MSTLFPWILALLIIAFFVRVFMLWRQLYKNYKYLRTKYPVSIWKLPSRNLHLMDEPDRKATVKLYWKYGLTLFLGMVIIIAFSALVQVFE